MSSTGYTEKQKAFLLYRESFLIISKLSMEQRGILLTAIFEYVEGNEIEELDPLTDIVFTQIKSYLDKNCEEWNRKSNQNRINANKKWEKVKELEKMQSHTTECQRINSHYNNVKVKEKGKGKDIINSAEAPEKKKSIIKKSIFIPPTLEEIKNYIDEKGYSVDAKTFFDYYDTSQWHDQTGKPIKNWKQKVISWSGRNSQSNANTKKGVTINEEQRKGYTNFDEFFDE